MKAADGREITAELLWDLYVEKDKSNSQIAEELGITYNQAASQRRKYKISIFNKWGLN